MTEYGPWLGGTIDIYNTLAEQAREGQGVEIKIPGLAHVVKTTIKIARYGAHMVNVAGEDYFLGDRSNGYAGADHQWTFRLEVLETPLPTRPGIYRTNGAEGDTTLTKYRRAMLTTHGEWFWLDFTASGQGRGILEPVDERFAQQFAAKLVLVYGGAA